MLGKFLYKADRNLSDFISYDTGAMRELFRQTDFAVSVSGRGMDSHKCYHFDAKVRTIIHFDLNRWHAVVQREVKRSSAAALLTQQSLRAMLVENSKTEGSVVVGFDLSPIYSANSLAIDSAAVVTKYKVNIDQWDDMEVSDY